MRNIRDCLYRVRPEEKSAGLPSPFNITEASFSLGDSARDDVEELFGQRAAETGQVFEPSALDRALLRTEGQPWLVNALAKDAIERWFDNGCSRTVTGLDKSLAARDMLLRDEIRFCCLPERLKEPSARRAIEPVPAGARSLKGCISDDDAAYAIDPGIMKMDPGNGESLRASNLFYGELIVRALTWKLKIVQRCIPKQVDGRGRGRARHGRPSQGLPGLLEGKQRSQRKDRERKSETHRRLKIMVAKTLTNTEIAEKFHVHGDIVKIITDNLS
ncbi:MAG: hypothetical protein LBQ12_14440 [Deltaproteobacteria bacterium]|jgi:hypothetical protein|nr:hypothetical protein [Deltaproteobacteria bacterium]